MADEELPQGGEISDEDRKLADQTTQRILRGYGLGDENEKPFWKIDYKSPQADVYLADVEADGQAFSQQLSLAIEEGDGGYPCIARKDGNPVPIDVMDLYRGFAYLYPYSKRPFPPFHPYRFMLREFKFLVADLLPGQPFEIVEIDSGKVVGFFRERVVSFLATRFSARAAVANSPGIRFTVNTQNPGERVHYSPAYFQKLSTVFGSPTTPVKGWIQPGRYTFSVVGVNGQMRFDPAHYPVPPKKDAHLII
jgi:hypothetical protein